jgi:hypothetical protein
VKATLTASSESVEVLSRLELGRFEKAESDQIGQTAKSIVGRGQEHTGSLRSLIKLISRRQLTVVMVESRVDFVRAKNFWH